MDLSLPNSLVQSLIHRYDLFGRFYSASYSLPSITCIVIRREHIITIQVSDSSSNKEIFAEVIEIKAVHASPCLNLTQTTFNG